MKQQERQQKSREKILSAAMKEFAERGMREVTVDSIRQKYEISKGMLYHYYSGKDALFLLCVQHTFSSWKSTCWSAWSSWSRRTRWRRCRNTFCCGELFQENPQQKQIFEAALLRRTHPADGTD